MAVMGFLREHNTKKTVEQASLIVPKDFKHSLCTGSTGSGKTTSFLYPNIMDRLEHGHGILLYDYKGKEHKSVKYFADKYNRLDDILEIGNPYSSSCNLISYFNEGELKKFVSSLMSLGQDNSYWEITSSNIVVAIWKSVKAYLAIIEAASDINNKRSFNNVIDRFKLPTAVTFTEIVNVTQSIKKIALFLIKLQKLSARFMIMTQKKIEDYYESHGSDASKDKYLALITKTLAFESIVNNELKALEVFKDALEDDGNRSTSLTTLMIAMGPPFSSVADNKMFNDSNGIDIAKALNDGKIIIVNSQELNTPLLASFTGSILNELSKRSGQTNINPISVFLDEAQRILTPEVPIFSDVLRENFVEIFIVTQSISLMQEVLGARMFLGIYENLNTILNFKSTLDREDLETSNLDTFEYFLNGINTVHTAVPVFLDKNEVFDVEIKYFNQHCIYDKLNIDKKDRNMVIQFNSYLFQQGKINLVSRDGKVKTIKLRSKENELVALQAIEKIIQSHAVVLKRKQIVKNPGTSDTALSDLFTQKMNEINLAKEH